MSNPKSFGGWSARRQTSKTSDLQKGSDFLGAVRKSSMMLRAHYNRRTGRICFSSSIIDPD